MIIVKLKGGLGNQMFQYALGRCLAEKNKDKLIFDATQLLDRTPRNITFRDYGLDIFNIDNKFTFLSKVSRLIPVPMMILGVSYLITKIKNLLGIQKYINENIDKNIIEFDERILNLNGNIYLDGYWQSEKYFKEIERIIRNDFTFNNQLSKKAQDLAEKIKSSNSVCLCVRRGDYLSSPAANKIHGFIGMEYYNQAVDVIASKIKNPHFFIFSDDDEWCKNNFKLKFPQTIVTNDYLGKKYNDYLHLMTLCNHFIIPNSTFGWWGAWLSLNEEKIIIAPMYWYKNNHFVARDLLPNYWIKI